jgi:hypothetical protein
MKGLFVRSPMIAACCFAVFAAGCGGDSDSTTAPTNEFGHYTLLTVNGQALPYSIPQTASGSVVIQTAGVDLSAGSSKPQYTAGVVGLVNGQGPTQIVADQGGYTLTGTTVTFTSAIAAGVSYVGTISGAAMTMTLPGALFGTSGTLVLSLKKG